VEYRIRYGAVGYPLLPKSEEQASSTAGGPRSALNVEQLAVKDEEDEQALFEKFLEEQLGMSLEEYEWNVKRNPRVADDVELAFARWKAERRKRMR